MLVFRSVLAAITIVLGIAIVARMLGALHAGGFEIVPGLALGGAMIALGAHRLSLIARAQGARSRRP